MMFDLSLSAVLTIIWCAVFVLAIFALAHWAVQQRDAQSEMIGKLLLPHRPTASSKPSRIDAAPIKIFVVDTADMDRAPNVSRSDFAPLPAARNVVGNVQTRTALHLAHSTHLRTQPRRLHF